MAALRSKKCPKCGIKHDSKTPCEPNADARIFKAYEDLPPGLRELAMLANDRAELMQFEGEMDHPEEK